MAEDLTIDPDWAWQPFTPSDSRQWDHVAAAHLYRRAGFGADIALLDGAARRSPRDVVDELVSLNLETSEFRSVADSLAQTLLAGGDPMKLSAAWVYRMLFTPAQLLEKTTLFWHGHFATGADKVKDASMMWRQNQLLRRHALGDFHALTQAIAKDPAMLIYLDSASNRKSHPNENFARELMELFCLGEGHYTEADVVELARCFTGWEIRNNRFRKNRYQHDDGEKSILGKRGVFDGEQAVEIVISKDDVPRFICRKLARYFIADELQWTDDLIDVPARTMRDHGLQIAPVLRQMLSSNLFYSAHARARKIKSPVELVIGMLRGLRGTTNSQRVAQGLRAIGQGLFYPPNVKGWDGGRAWINSSTVLGRANLFEQILSDGNTRFDGESLTQYLAGHDVHDAAEALDHFERCLMAVPINPANRQSLIAQFGSLGNDHEKAYRRLLHAVCSLPEFQLA
ncbi:hypothetical protein Mal15_02630 [Stieleria maiorica]|uniref:DUF1800 domain-containing protein n=1 Tax=Stieleria maiorica TaxID=2795974 RepID=A0A5B9M7W2_9BACT|nr:DUF1800 domain-containing protein [Stieleria maiorica]QEF96236.1 hypothetical protein Mal15_02630 [Stieleria maiorica]